ncbi:MAG: valine--tRNA ligase [Actinomycetota bacterium]
MELATLYNPHGVEERWQQTWEAEGLYRADDADETRPTYVIAVPPPNVTGALHMGHALNGTIQDALIRWHRMRGFNTLWQPGYDHAAISTEMMVERQLRTEGTSRFDLGREQFLERVWEWLHQYGGIIMGQFRRLGCSLDYDRERFTMDDGYVRAVYRFFVDLYERGYMYRDNRIVNWCTDCASTVSDLEVEHIDVDDTLTYARYPLVDGDGSVTIATVRPATILADVAVAVHPEDDRYKHLIGKHVRVPVVDRVVPIIGDEAVETDFGTGALKITPGHDPVDFEIGRKHGLEELTVIGLDGRMTGDIPDEYKGLTEDEAADKVVQWLKDNDRLEKREHYRHAVGHCDRSGTRIQPLVLLQWWCEMGDLARPALEAIESGRVRFHPPVHGRVAADWLRAIRPWNVSRQQWWGHQLPVWYCADGHVTVSETEPAACAECGAGELTRDPDVLDTWFSSALWPFATLGWPDDTRALRRFYPGDVDSTARDIIFLWVNRMIMAGLFELGDIPFHDVIIHSTILAPDGQRMSKSKGTGIDPLELIDQHGADSTRYGLLKMSSTQDVRFSSQQIEEGRRLANKLWNASRLLLMAGPETPDAQPSSEEERWILARIDATRQVVEDDLAKYDFSHAVDRLYHLTFDDFCDWYLEAIKPRLGDAQTRATAFAALERLLKLLHPVLPHVTEEIWTHLPGRESRLIVAPWPEPLPQETSGEIERAQTAARIYRRSGVRIALAGDAERIFTAVVRPSANGGGDVGKERDRLRKEIERGERMLANEKFVANAAPDVVDAEREKLEQYRAELDALG